MVDVEVSGKLPAGFPTFLVNKLADLSLKTAGFDGRYTVAVAIVSDAKIRRLNKVWRGIDRVTDVLSFGYRPGSGFVDTAGTSSQLGDIVISLPQVRRQAKAIGRPVRQELALMIVHGLLHLLGLNHDTPRKEARMFGLQQEVLMLAGVL